MRIEVIEVGSCQKCRHYGYLAYYAKSYNDIRFCHMANRAVYSDDIKNGFPDFCKLEKMKKMKTILLVLCNIVYGFLSIVCGLALFYSDYQTVKEFMGLLSSIFIFGGLFSIALIETINNLIKGIWW